jgi:hypothetical protein
MDSPVIVQEAGLLVVGCGIEVTEGGEYVFYLIEIV